MYTRIRTLTKQLRLAQEPAQRCGDENSAIDTAIPTAVLANAPLCVGKTQWRWCDQVYMCTGYASCLKPSVETRALGGAEMKLRQLINVDFPNPRSWLHLETVQST